MDIQLVKGHFSPQEALELITQMIHVKIKYHESKIQKYDNEEDIKSSEKRITSLQKDLFELRQNISKHSNKVDINAHVQIT
jgi:hypothetical protein